jgi:hypothetical protein
LLAFLKLKLPILAQPQIFSGDPPFKDISSWPLLRSNVVKSANRPAKPQSQADIDRGLDDKLWSLIEDCWSQMPSKRPTAATVSLILGDVNGYPVGPEFVQPHTTLKQGQDLNISISQEHSSTGRASGISSLHQPNVVTPLAQRQNVRNSTEIWTALRDREKYRNDSITRCVPIQGETPPC